MLYGTKNLPTLSIVLLPIIIITVGVISDIHSSIDQREDQTDKSNGGKLSNIYYLPGSDVYFIISNCLPDWMVYILYRIFVASESSEQRTLKLEI